LTIDILKLTQVFYDRFHKIFTGWICNKNKEILMHTYH